MRILVTGGDDGQRGLIARALSAAGCALAADAAGCDLVVTLGGGGADPLRRSGFTLDPTSAIVRRGQRDIRLSRIEVTLLAALMRSDAPLDRRALIALVWGYAHDPGTNIVAVHVSRLRAKLGADAIRLVVGGYEIGG